MRKYVKCAVVGISRSQGFLSILEQLINRTKMWSLINLIQTPLIFAHNNGNFKFGIWLNSSGGHAAATKYVHWEENALETFEVVPGYIKVEVFKSPANL